jgi:hypothetical protein
VLACRARLRMRLRTRTMAIGKSHCWNGTPLRSALGLRSRHPYERHPRLPVFVALGRA